MIKWEGWAKNRQCPIDTLDEDSDGSSLDLTLLPYDDGRPPPQLVDHPWTTDGAQHGEAAGEDHNDHEEDEGAREAEVTITARQPVKPLNISSQTWSKLEPEGVAHDERQTPRQQPVLNAGFGFSNISSVFHYLLPDAWIDVQLNYTNLKLQGHNSLCAKVTKGELLQFWGYVLACSVHKGLPLEQMWSDMPQPESILPPPALGRHGMSLNRFKKLRATISFGPSDEQSLRADPWAFVRKLVDEFNLHRAVALSPGWLLTVDESMIAWRGQVGLLDSTKCPHRSWVPRKPEPLGVELKTAGDALSGILLRMEICEGAAAMREKEFSADWGVTTATTMRLFKPWFGTGRVAAGDSWFASVKTARAMLDRGLHFIGDVKTNTSLFPKEALDEATSSESGAWATYKSMLALHNGNEVPIFCVSHRRGESVHKFIATCGTTLKGSATKAYFEDDEDRANAQLGDFELTRKAPRVLNDYTLAQPCLDRHNRYRQFILGMEKRLLTNNFAMRFGTSLHGMIFTDTFFAYRYFVDKDAVFSEEMSKLAYCLMHNDFLPRPAASPQSQPSVGRGSPQGACVECDIEHDLVPLKYIAGFDGYRQQRCIMCNKPTAWCCRVCTNGPLSLVPLCPTETIVRRGADKGERKKHACLRRHRTNPALLPRGRKGSKRARRATANQGSDSQVDGSDTDEQYDAHHQPEEDPMEA